MKIYKNISELIGHTPLLDITKYFNNKTDCKILAKLECFNPAGSIKDRAALFMIDVAEKKDLLKSGSVIIEPTSGNTGIGLCAVAAERGYEVILTMPETMSLERRKLLKAFGAKIILTDGRLGMAGAVEKANELAKEYKNSFIPSQFENPANPAAHYNTTGPEIYKDTEGNVDIFVACVGTGGTLSGTGKYLKEQNPDVRVVAVEPDDSPLLSKGIAGPHKIQGIGANFVPDNLDKEIYDEIKTVTSDESYCACRILAKKAGILVGISSGAAVSVAAELSKLPENSGKTIVVILPDTGERYLSTDLFEES
ncbi:MAG: cysteine synthase A [Clostridia bacterium]|nr:cysteine synthase A [Clostridia bacterium]